MADNDQLRRFDFEPASFPPELGGEPFEAEAYVAQVLSKIENAPVKAGPGIGLLESAPNQSARGLGQHLRGIYKLETGHAPGAQKAFGDAAHSFSLERMHVLAVISAYYEYGTAVQQHRDEGARAVVDSFTASVQDALTQLDELGPRGFTGEERLFVQYMFDRFPANELTRDVLNLFKKMTPDDKELAAGWIEWSANRWDTSPEALVANITNGLKQKTPTKDNMTRQAGVLVELGKQFRYPTPEQRRMLPSQLRTASGDIVREAHLEAKALIKQRRRTLLSRPRSTEVESELQQLEDLLNDAEQSLGSTKH